MKEQSPLHIQRHELKFYITHTDYHYMRSQLQALMQRDSFQNEEDGYWIRSLYFDDIHDSAVQDKLAGIEHRDKYRLRIYDTEQNWAKLERKRKVNDYVQKSSVTITKEHAIELSHGNIDVLKEYSSKSAREIYYDFLRAYIRPVVIVDYIRDAYILPYNNIRITFDKQLRADTTDLNLFKSSVVTQSMMPEALIILEVKYNNFLPAWFAHMIQPTSATRSAISKYTISRIGIPQL